MLRRLLEKLGLRFSQLSQDELADEEAMRRQAEAERVKAETRMAQQRGEIEGGGSRGPVTPPW
jgi:hypothetical protein